MKSLAKVNYSRNMWRIMKEFNTLPTNKDFKALQEEQIEFILYNMEEDVREKRRAQKGVVGEGDYYDSSFEDEVWNAKPGEWSTVVEGDDPDRLAEQVRSMTKKEDQEKLDVKRDTASQYGEHREQGGQSQREAEVSGYIERQMQFAREQAEAKANGEDIRITQNNAGGSPEFKPISNEDVKEALGDWDDFEDL